MRGVFLRKADRVELLSEPPTDEAIRQATGVDVVRRLGRGWRHHAVYEVRADGARAALKLAQSAGSVASLVVERRVYAALGPLAGVDVLGSGDDWLLLGWAEGRCLRDVALDDPSWPEVARDLGARLARIHALPLAGEGFGLLRGGDDGLEGDVASWSRHVAQARHKYVAPLLRDGWIDDPTARRAEAAIEDALERASAVRAASLLHGDLGSHNLFVDGDRVTAIIDWEDAMRGDPLYDVAMFASFYRMTEQLPAFADGYGLDLDAVAPRLWAYYTVIALAKAALHRQDRGDQGPAIAKLRDGLERWEAAR